LALEHSKEVSGLEIAWHCVRAGRREEALPHLLSGARQAMRRGAAHLAQRALETALPGMSERDSTDARLILAEALQEQGRWRESLDLLRCTPIHGNDAAMYAEVLEASALRRLGSHYVAELQARIPRLICLAHQGSAPRTRVKAAQVIAYLAIEVRDRQLAQTLLGGLQESPDQADDEDVSSQWDLTRALLLRLIGETAASEELVTSAIEKLHASGTVNLLAVQLVGVLGTLNTLEGKYSEAVANFLRCHELAARAGIETIVAEMAGNLSLSYGRLGDYTLQLEWANRVPNPWGTEFAGFIEVQVAYNKGIAHGMRGQPGLIADTIASLERRMDDSLAPWILQAWQLWKADLLALMGRRSEAIIIARRTFTCFGLSSLASSFTGALDRWLGVACAPGEQRRTARLLLQTHVGKLAEFDALDQVEILCAALELAESGAERLESEKALQERLQTTPMGVVTLLRRLEFVPF